MHAEAKERSAKMLAKFASKNEEHSALLVKAGAISPLVALLTKGTSGSKEASASTLAYVGANNASRQALIADAGAISPLADLLRTGSNKVQQQAAAALGSLSESPDYQLPMIKSGVIAPLVRLLREGIDDAKISAAACLSNLCTASPEARASVADAGAVPLLLGMISSGKTQTSAAHALAELCASHEPNQVGDAQKLSCVYIIHIVCMCEQVYMYIRT